MPTGRPRSPEAYEKLIHEGTYYVVKSETPEERIARLEEEAKESDHRRKTEAEAHRDRIRKGWYMLGLAGVTTLGCFGMILSGGYSPDNVGKAPTILAGVLSGGLAYTAGLNAGKSGK